MYIFFLLHCKYTNKFGIKSKLTFFLIFLRLYNYKRIWIFTTHTALKHKVLQNFYL